MTSEHDLLAQLVAYHDNIDAPVVPIEADVHRGRRRVRRNRGIATGSVAAAVAAVVLTASLIGRGDTTTGPEPAPSPSVTITDPALANGPITDAQAHFGDAISNYDWRGFEPGSGTGLFVTWHPCQETGCNDFHDYVDGITVLGPNSQITRLRCPRDFPCRQGQKSAYGAAALGPGIDKVTVVIADGAVQVFDADGQEGRTYDLTGLIEGLGDIADLEWSADGRRLAVLTQDTTGGATVGRVWLVDRDGGEPELAYSVMKPDPYFAPLTLDAKDFDATATIASLDGWSPDGQSLLLDQYPEVVVLRLREEAAGRPMSSQILYRTDRHFDWAGNLAWSPDGTRVAVRTKGHIVEVSAEDGQVLAQHPHSDGPLIWLAQNQ